jgi:galactokinase
MARESGAIASSAFGAGFGGSVWAMVPADDTTDFLQRWTDMYRAAYPETGARAAFFVTRAAPPAQLW